MSIITSNNLYDRIQGKFDDETSKEQSKLKGKLDEYLKTKLLDEQNNFINLMYKLN